MELTSWMKMPRFQFFGSRCGKTNLWTKVTKQAKPQGRKWRFTLKRKNLWRLIRIISWKRYVKKVYSAFIRCSYNNK
ncbi:hypothetical protein Hanom_Chr07g00585981 [Helianthus anomalus]